MQEVKFLNGETISIDEFVDMLSVNPWILRKVVQTPQICSIAINTNAWNITRVNEPSEELWLMALRKVPEVLEYISDPTEEMYLTALKRDSNIFAHLGMENVPDLSFLCLSEKGLEIIKQNPELLQNMQNQTEDACLCAVESDGLALQYVTSKTPKIITAALKESLDAQHFIFNWTDELINILKSEGFDFDEPHICAYYPEWEKIDDKIAMAKTKTTTAEDVERGQTHESLRL